MPAPSDKPIDVAGFDAGFFWAKIAPKNERGCMLWTGHTVGDYGALKIRGRQVYAHRMAWTLARGQIPAGLIVRHVECGDPLCCNPAHLALGTQAENVADTKRMGRMNPPRGERSPNAKLTDADVTDMRKRAASGETAASIAKDFGLSVGGAGFAISAVTWGHLPPVDGRRRRDKLTADDAQFARDWVGAGWTQCAVAKALRVAPSLISMTISGKRHAIAA